jgi:hypothetical protein
MVGANNFPGFWVTIGPPENQTLTLAREQRELPIFHGTLHLTGHLARNYLHL